MYYAHYEFLPISYAFHVQLQHYNLAIYFVVVHVLCST